MLQYAAAALLSALLSASGFAIDATLLVGVVNLIAFSAVLFFALRHRGGDLAAAYEVRKFDPLSVLPIVLFVCGLSIALSEIDNLTRLAFPMPDALLKAMESVSPGKNALLASILALAVVAPLTEELFFRGLLLKGFLGHHSKLNAALVSAAFFALFHVNPWQFSGAFVAGLFFAYLFIRYRSVLPCILAHALHNFIPILAADALKLDIPGYTSPLAEHVFQPLWFDLLGAGLIALAVLLFLGIDLYRGKLRLASRAR